MKPGKWILFLVIVGGLNLKSCDYKKGSKFSNAIKPISVFKEEAKRFR